MKLMHILEAKDPLQWDAFLAAEPWSPFLQSWTMGEVYREIGQDPVRLEARDDHGGKIIGICQGIVVPARRGRHLMVQYGPVINSECRMQNIELLIQELKKIAKGEKCSFIRISPFWKEETAQKIPNTISSPLHLLAEYIWYLPLVGKTEETLLKNMRKTTRNLIGRAEREGVTVEASKNPVRDLPHFLSLHEETRKRHGFTPYTDNFFHAQVEQFARRNECTLYLAWYQKKVIAASIHIHAFGETSYHHGASGNAFSKIPASYLLQWTAIRDALKRRDRIYNFWGIAPENLPRHPFAGVTLFKKGFGGELLSLVPCMDIPLSKRYYVTRLFETFRKWRRGF